MIDWLFTAWPFIDHYWSVPNWSQCLARKPSQARPGDFPQTLVSLLRSVRYSTSCLLQATKAIFCPLHLPHQDAGKPGVLQKWVNFLRQFLQGGKGLAVESSRESITRLTRDKSLPWRDFLFPIAGTWFRQVLTGYQASSCKMKSRWWAWSSLVGSSTDQGSEQWEWPGEPPKKSLVGEEVQPSHWETCAQTLAPPVTWLLILGKWLELSECQFSHKKTEGPNLPSVKRELTFPDLEAWNELCCWITPNISISVLCLRSRAQPKFPNPISCPRWNTIVCNKPKRVCRVPLRLVPTGLLPSAHCTHSFLRELSGRNPTTTLSKKTWGRMTTREEHWPCSWWPWVPIPVLL